MEPENFRSRGRGRGRGRGGGRVFRGGPRRFGNDFEFSRDDRRPMQRRKFNQGVPIENDAPFFGDYPRGGGRSRGRGRGIRVFRGGNRSRGRGRGRGGFREGGFRDGGFREGGFREGGFREGGFRDGGFRDGGFREGGFREGGFRDGGFRDGGFREGGFRGRGFRGGFSRGRRGGAFGESFGGMIHNRTRFGRGSSGGDGRFRGRTSMSPSRGRGNRFIQENRPPAGIREFERPYRGLPRNRMRGGSSRGRGRFRGRPPRYQAYRGDRPLDQPVMGNSESRNEHDMSGSEDQNEPERTRYVASGRHSGSKGQPSFRVAGTGPDSK